ncbi:MAG: metallophosphoesterase [Chloroflexi bacterium]|nr:MAG: metallophosphoesterase [Chloroflexota bacterium]
MTTTFVIGDLHGQLDRTHRLLRTAGLVNRQLAWSGDNATLCFVGDYCDRGPHGLRCIELVMRLQQEAARAEGQVITLLGNHEVLLLAAHLFGDHRFDGIYYTFRELWQQNGGVQRDLDGLRPEHVAWLRTLPAVTQIGSRLLTHADALFYAELGQTPAAVNQVITELLKSEDPFVWQSLLETFTERLAFFENHREGASIASAFLAAFGAAQLIHGHTPIPYMTGKPAAQVTEPFVYADGLCVNVDGGMYMGGPGFITRFAG